MSTLREMFERATRKTGNRLALMVGRCVLAAAKDSGLQILQVEGLEGEVIDGAERIENYGLAGNPPAGSEGALLSVGGERAHALVVALENRAHRPPGLAPGEVKLYSMFKQFIHLDKEGRMIIEVPKELIIKAKSLQAELVEDIAFKSRAFNSTQSADIAFNGQRFGLAAPGGSHIDGDLATKGSIDATGDLTAGGQVRDHKSTMQGMRDIYNPHTHPETSKPTNEM